MLRLDGGGPDRLVFLPGFMSSASSYRHLLEPIAESGMCVIVPQLYPRAVATLLGRHGVQKEARAAADLVVRESAHGRVVLAGHSRGGQAAWLAAGLLADAGPRLPAALALIDPVDARGHTGTGPSRHVAEFDCSTLIIGAGVAGRCAPVGFNHEQFVAAAPSAAHVIVSDLGHVDMLGGNERAMGRALCGGGHDPDAARLTCAHLLLLFLTDQLPDIGQYPDFHRVR